MSQTMFAIVALMIFSLFAVSQQQRLFTAERVMIRNTVGRMANAIAVETLEEAAAKHFDQNTADVTLTNASQLTLKSNFGRNQDINNDDLDDWSSADVHPDSTLEDRSRFVRGAEVVFTRKAEVRYVERDGFGGWRDSPSQNRTKFKEMSVEVYAEGISLADTVRISQVVACGTACNW